MKKALILTLIVVPSLAGFTTVNRTLMAKKVSYNDAQGKSIKQIVLQPKKENRFTLSHKPSSLNVALSWEQVIKAEPQPLIAQRSYKKQQLLPLFARMPLKTVAAPVRLASRSFEYQVKPAGYEKTQGITDDFSLVIYEPQLDEPQVLLIGPRLRNTARLKTAAKAR